MSTKERIMALSDLRPGRVYYIIEDKQVHRFVVESVIISRGGWFVSGDVYYKNGTVSVLPKKFSVSRINKRNIFTTEEAAIRKLNNEELPLQKKEKVIMKTNEVCTLGVMISSDGESTPIYGCRDQFNQVTAYFNNDPYGIIEMGGFGNLEIVSTEDNDEVDMLEEMLVTGSRGKYTGVMLLKDKFLFFRDFDIMDCVIEPRKLGTAEPEEWSDGYSTEFIPYAANNSAQEHAIADALLELFNQV